MKRKRDRCIHVYIDVLYICIRTKGSCIMLTTRHAVAVVASCAIICRKAPAKATHSYSELSLPTAQPKSHRHDGHITRIPFFLVAFQPWIAFNVSKWEWRLAWAWKWEWIWRHMGKMGACHKNNSAHKFCTNIYYVYKVCKNEQRSWQWGYSQGCCTQK